MKVNSLSNVIYELQAGLLSLCAQRVKHARSRMAVCAQRMGMSTQGDNDDIEMKYVEGKLPCFRFGIQ